MAGVVDKIKQVPLGKLSTWERNPRSITRPRFEALMSSMAADPEMLQARPVIALEDGRVIAGNMRLLAARELDWKTIATVTVHGLSEAEATSWALRDNNAYGEWDDQALSELLRELDDAGADLNLLGFPTPDLDAFLNMTADQSRDPDATPPVPTGEPRSKAGEIYELGSHRLMCGDATDPDHVKELLAGEPVALVFTSPPYLDARDYGAHDDDGLSVTRLAEFLPAWAAADLIAMNLGIIRKDGSVRRYWDTYIAAAETAGLKLLAWNVWDRGQPWTIAQNTAMFATEHEFIFVFGKQPQKLSLTVPNKSPGLRTGITNRQKDGSLKRVKSKRVHDFRRLGSVFRSPPYLGPDTGHPAQFPIGLPTAYIEAASGRDDVVGEPFAGSGTTLIAAEMTGRRCRAMEIDPGYCDVVRDRYEAYAAQA